jgi:uncharacterized protein YqjF (DUF2071 family)
MLRRTGPPDGRALGTCLTETNVRLTSTPSPDLLFSLEASFMLAVVSARSLYGLPYYPTAISLERQGAT